MATGTYVVASHPPIVGLVPWCPHYRHDTTIGSFGVFCILSLLSWLLYLLRTTQCEGVCMILMLFLFLKIKTSTYFEFL